MGNADGSRKFKGLAWLFMGVPYSKSLLYDDEHREYKKNYPDQFRYDYAVSREQKNAAGQKMYIQTKMAEFADELWELMQSPKTHIYMRVEGHGKRHGGVLQSARREERHGLEGVRQEHEEGEAIPRGGLLRG